MHQVRIKAMIQKIVFYEELEQVFDHFPRYHTKILLGDFNAKVGRENIFKPTIGNLIFVVPCIMLYNSK